MDEVTKLLLENLSPELFAHEAALFFSVGISTEETATRLRGLALARVNRASQSNQRCSSCKYFFGNQGIVCAVHPGGNDNCSDWESKK